MDNHIPFKNQWKSSWGIDVESFLIFICLPVLITRRYRFNNQLSGALDVTASNSLATSLNNNSRSYEQFSRGKLILYRLCNRSLHLVAVSSSIRSMCFELFKSTSFKISRFFILGTFEFSFYRFSSLLLLKSLNFSRALECSFHAVLNQHHVKIEMTVMLWNHVGNS